MTSSTHTVQRLAAALAIALAVAMLAVPSALAAGRCPCNSGLPMSAEPIQTGTASPRIVHVVQSSGFAWGDFGLGIAAAVGGLLVLGGLGIGVRRAQRAHDPIVSV